MAKSKTETPKVNRTAAGVLTTPALAAQFHAFVVSGTGPWTNMPATPKPSDTTPSCSYELDGEIDNEGYLNFYLIPGRDTWMPNDNQLMNMNVHHECTITLTLSNNLSWYFPEKKDINNMDAVMLGTPASPQYSALTRVPSPGAGKCTRVWFFAKKSNAPTMPPNYDPIVICVALDQKGADDKPSTVPLVLLIDPGIKNPGDDPP